jgi:tetratricopeptide (TPR) repeat protein
MPVLNAQVDGCPNADEVRAALSHMAASEAFRGSPQLISFLRYVVEATLRGEQDRIKGYTIAVEALGRADDFNPQSDPIVRVEATRLRRTINRYYENGGKLDPVQIDLPLGSYVPTFRRGAILPAPVAAPPPERPRARRSFDWHGASWRSLGAAAVLVALGAGAYGGLDFWFDFNTPNPQPAAPSTAAQLRGAVGWRAATTPVIFIGTFRSGKNREPAPETDSLRGKLRDALARFDEVQVVFGVPSGDARGASDGESVSRYALTATIEPEETGAIRLRLTDVDDGQVAYAHTFSRVQHGDEDAIVRSVSAVLAQPYGIVQANERAKQTRAGSETEFRCLIEAHDYWRSYNPAQYQRARDCLERTIEANPGFALGHAALAQITLEEHRNGVNLRGEDVPALQRALTAARRAVELKPGSARAHQALADVQFARGDYPLAIEAGERAVALNPYDPNVLAGYGGILVSLGERERGARLIKDAASALAVRPVWHDFLLFLTAYLADDPAGAMRYAALIAPDGYPLGLVARALVAAQRGEPETARRLLDRLAATRPAWRKDCRGELAKFFPAIAIVDRIERDIAQIGAIPGG